MSKRGIEVILENGVVLKQVYQRGERFFVDDKQVLLEGMGCLCEASLNTTKEKTPREFLRAILKDWYEEHKQELDSNSSYGFLILDNMKEERSLGILPNDDWVRTDRKYSAQFIPCKYVPARKH